jgi:hypothetical protein
MPSHYLPDPHQPYLDIIHPTAPPQEPIVYGGELSGRKDDTPFPTYIGGRSTRGFRTDPFPELRGQKKRERQDQQNLDRIVAFFKSKGVIVPEAEEATTAVSIVGDMVQDMIYRGLLDPKFADNAVRYLYYRFGGGEPVPYAGGIMGRPAEGRAGQIKVASDIVATGYVMEYISIDGVEDQFVALFDPDDVMRILQEENKGIEEGFFEMKGALEDEVLHWENVITTYPDMPLSSDKFKHVIDVDIRTGRIPGDIFDRADLEEYLGETGQDLLTLARTGDKPGYLPTGMNLMDVASQVPNKTLRYLGYVQSTVIPDALVTLVRPEGTAGYEFGLSSGNFAKDMSDRGLEGVPYDDFGRPTVTGPPEDIEVIANSIASKDQIKAAVSTAITQRGIATGPGINRKPEIDDIVAYSTLVYNAELASTRSWAFPKGDPDKAALAAAPVIIAGVDVIVDATDRRETLEELAGALPTTIKEARAIVDALNLWEPGTSPYWPKKGDETEQYLQSIEHAKEYLAKTLLSQSKRSASTIAFYLTANKNVPLTQITKDNPSISTTPEDMVRETLNTPEMVGIMGGVFTSQRERLTYDDQVEADNLITSTYNTDEGAQAAIATWEESNSVYLKNRPGALPGGGLTDIERNWLVVELVNAGNAHVPGGPERALRASELITDRLLNSEAGPYYTNLGLEGAAEERAVKAALTEAKGWGQADLTEWLDNTPLADGSRIQMSLEDQVRAIRYVNNSESIKKGLEDIFARAEEGLYTQPFLQEQARIDPEEFVRQHFRDTGVLTTDSSIAFMTNLEEQAIMPIALKLITAMAGGQPPEDIEKFVADTIRDTVASFDLDESKFPKTEDDRFFSFDERLLTRIEDRSGFPGTTQLPTPSYYLSGPFEGDIVEPSTRRARLGGSELDQALAPLYETEDLDFLNFLGTQRDELLKGYSYAAVPQVNEEEQESLINLVYEQRAKQREALRVYQEEVPLYQRGRRREDIGYAGGRGPSLSEVLPEGTEFYDPKTYLEGLPKDEEGRPIDRFGPTPQGPIIRPGGGATGSTSLVNLTDSKIIGKAQVAATTPGLTPQEYIASMMPGLREEYATSPFGLLAKARDSAEAGLPKPVRRFPTRFRKVRT